MMRSYLARGDRPLHWAGGSKKDYDDLPALVQRDMGWALNAVQLGGKPQDAKPWKGEGSGVLEIVVNHRGDTFRAIYTVRFAKAIYVLHAFQKKSKSGIKTDRLHQELVASRLREAERDYEKRYGRN